MRQGSCAYVGQNPWLINTTLGENILFGEAYDAKRYYETQIVCKLRQSIKELPSGTEITISDSGCEIPMMFKQKIALARAFYADR
jgi:ABC-type transport system involved in cytochrome bd biosynthesis fused ATPase/permease subunit